VRYPDSCLSTAWTDGHYCGDNLFSSAPRRAAALTGPRVQSHPTRHFLLLLLVYYYLFPRRLPHWTCADVKLFDLSSSSSLKRGVSRYPQSVLKSGRARQKTRTKPKRKAQPSWFRVTSHQPSRVDSALPGLPGLPGLLRQPSQPLCRNFPSRRLPPLCIRHFS
jgi:hypothetical protein